MLNKYIPIAIDKIRELRKRLGKWIRDVTRPRHTKHLSVVTDLFRSKTELVAENALLRQQLIVLNRQVKNRDSLPQIGQFLFSFLVLSALGAMRY